VCLARDRASELIFAAFIEQSRRGYAERSVARCVARFLSSRRLPTSDQVDKNRRNFATAGASSVFRGISGSDHPNGP